MVAAGSLLLTAVLVPASLWFQGYRMYVVHTGSMTPTYRPGDIVVDRPNPSTYTAGEVITFRHSDLSSDVVTHRVVSVNAQGIHTKGDANATPDAWTIRPDQVRGQAVLDIRRAGYVAVYFQQPAGIASVVTVVAGAMLLWGLFFPAEGSGQTTEQSQKGSDTDSEPSPEGTGFAYV
jgi:signal peptidase